MKAVLKTVAKAAGLILALLAAVISLPSIQAAVRLVITASIGGISLAVAHLRYPVRLYLRGLDKLATITFIPPLLLGLLAVHVGWMTFIAWLGLWTFVWTLVLAHWAAPLGVLIEALVSTRASTTDGLQTRWLGERLKTYIGYVRAFLIAETAAAATFSIVPFHHYKESIPKFLLVSIFVWLASFHFDKKIGKWLKPATIFAGIGMAMFFVIRCFLPVLHSKFPQVSWFQVFVGISNGGALPEGLSSDPGAITTTNVLTAYSSATTRISDWFNTGWTRPSFWVFWAFIALLVWVIVYFVRKNDHHHDGGTDHHAASSHHDEHHGMPWPVMLVLLALVAVMAFWIYGKLNEVKVIREVKAAEIEEIKARGEKLRQEESAVAAAKVAARAVTAALAKAAAPARVVTRPTEDNPFPELRKPTILPMTLTGEWSVPITRPHGYSVRIHPRGLVPQYRFNGEVWDHPRLGNNIPPWVDKIEIRWTNVFPEAIDVIVGVGKKVSCD